jgi:hypothetical protein
MKTFEQIAELERRYLLGLTVGIRSRLRGGRMCFFMTLRTGGISALFRGLE